MLKHHFNKQELLLLRNLYTVQYVVSIEDEKQLKALKLLHVLVYLASLRVYNRGFLLLCC
jgi:hypothetical protein